LRTATRRIDQRSVVLTATLGGLGLGVLYVIGGPEVRFAGIPEILILVEEQPGVGVALFAVLVKLLATAWCLAAGYRGGKIFPITFLGAATGLAVHAVFDGLPVSVALGCGIAGALATGLGTPVTAALVAGVVLGPDLLPVAIISVVAAHTVHLLAAQLAPLAPPTPPGDQVAPAA
jgi:H+/Cl- antiporter ClcA